MSISTIAGPTAGQLKYGSDLIDAIEARGHRGPRGEEASDAWAARARNHFAGLDIRQASEALDRLKDLKTSLPEPARPAPRREPEVAEGRYALDTEAGVKFYRIRSPKSGRFKGRTMLDTQAGDDFHLVRSRDTRLEVLESIATDPAAAMIRYGKALGTCGNCGRTLTDPQSVLRGLGPVCYSVVYGL